ncbi:MAG: NAD(P)/FAD-dependent oxidoreductase [Acidimicrobiales bacterium]|nr:NAD(P)/FAD-dependent oxidoreductase [Acidimicrobiales bacterium]
MASPTPQAIVIGSGSGGLTVAIGLSRIGRSAILVEDHHVGGDCTNVGCIPSKSLLHHSADGTLPPAEALSQVRASRTALRDHETELVKTGTERLDFRVGRGRLLSPGRVEITAPDGSTEIVEAPNVVVATGSQPRSLEIPGLPSEMLLTNNNLFELGTAPEHLAIIGGGPIGVEMATAFRRMGSQVTLVEFLPQILTQLLPEPAAILHRSLEAMGVRIEVAAKATAFEAATGTLLVEPVDGANPVAPISSVDAVLVSVGRVPNSKDLGLEVLDVAMDKSGRIVIDAKGRTNVAGLWACGDVTDRGGTTHAAGAWGRRILRAMVSGPLPMPDVPPIPAAVFGDPEAAWIGEQPVEVPSDVRRITVETSDIDRSYTDQAGEGIVIVDVRRLTGKILGATIVGPRAGELIGTVSLSMKTDVPFHKWYGTVWPYPTYSDGLSRAVDAYIAEALPSVHKDALRWALGRAKSLIKR